MTAGLMQTIRRWDATRAWSSLVRWPHWGSSFVLVWFQPQKLLIDTSVDERSPVPVNPVATAAGATTDPTAPTDGSTASARPPGPACSCRATSVAWSTRPPAGPWVVELADGRRFLRFEDLHTSNGPDLRVCLSEAPAGDDWYAYGERFVDLGPPKGNLGNQNYEVPADVDVSRYRSAVIWCRRFTVGFGVSPLDPAGARAG